LTNCLKAARIPYRYGDADLGDKGVDAASFSRRRYGDDDRHDREPKRGGVETMRSCRQSWILGTAALLAAVCLGCQPQQPPSGSGQPGDQPGPASGVQETPTNTPPVVDSVPAEPPPPPTIPTVSMTRQDRDKCLLWVGDIMPEAELPDPSGVAQPLAKLRGPKLTVVCFWRSGDKPFAQEVATQTLADLEQVVHFPYREKGVQVIGINEGDRPEAVRQRVAEAKVTFPCLLDPDGALLAKVATEGLPRVYLLDADGSILWLDAEFSLATRRALEKGIQVALGEI
jgi:peroxiredoxin